jgi:hypothetical protein
MSDNPITDLRRRVLQDMSIGPLIASQCQVLF